MKTIELSGIIKFEYDNWNKVKLLQEDGYKIDLVNRFSEIKESYPNSKFQINYWLSDKICTKDEIVEGLLQKLYGFIEAGYEQEDYHYSSWTNGTDYNTTLKIGGHNLDIELIDEEDRFMILEINVEDTKNK